MLRRRKPPAQAMRAEYEQKIGSVKKEADEILSEARKKAQYRENQIVAEAQEEAARDSGTCRSRSGIEKKKAMEDGRRDHRHSVHDGGQDCGGVHR